VRGQQQSEIEERRKDVRYLLQFPIIFRWRHRTVHLGAGFTRNVSLTGLFVNSAAIPELKTHLKCQLLLPTSGNNAGNAIRATGRVVRISTDDENRGFAIRAKLNSSNSRRKQQQQQLSTVTPIC